MSNRKETNMITSSIENTGVKFELSGLSTDAKPTVTFDGKEIANGSSFLEMDTQDVKFYSKATESWI